MRFLTFILILFFSVNVFAENAKVKFMIGKVDMRQASNQEGWKALTMQTAVKEKNSIRTGKESFCELSLPDGSITKILENSILELRDFPDPADETMDLFAGLGKFFFSVKKTFSRKFKVSSPVAVAAIRGTEFMLINQGGDTKLLVGKGSVDFSDTYMRNTVQVKAGYKSTLIAGESPKQPEPLTKAEKEALKKLSVAADTETGKPEFGEFGQPVRKATQTLFLLQFR